MAKPGRDHRARGWSGRGFERGQPAIDIAAVLERFECRGAHHRVGVAERGDRAAQQPIVDERHEARLRADPWIDRGVRDERCCELIVRERLRVVGSGDKRRRFALLALRLRESHSVEPHVGRVHRVKRARVPLRVGRIPRENDGLGRRGLCRWGARRPNGDRSRPSTFGGVGGVCARHNRSSRCDTPSKEDANCNQPPHVAS